MNAEYIKTQLNPGDVKSLLYWQKEIHKEFERCEKEYDSPEEDILDLYDFIMHKLAWEYIKLKEN